VPPPLLQTFPFSSTLGEVTLHLLSQACMFICSSHGKWAFPLSCGVFLPLPLLQAFPLLVAGQVLPLPPSLAGSFIYSSMRDCPSPLFGDRDTPPSLLHVFFFFLAACLLFSLFFFPPGWELVCPWGYADLAQGCLWEYCVPLSSPGGLLLPSRLGAGIWWHKNPPGFSI
jgi:hypothetical protein